MALQIICYYQKDRILLGMFLEPPSSVCLQSKHVSQLCLHSTVTHLRVIYFAFTSKALHMYRNIKKFLKENLFLLSGLSVSVYFL